MNPPPAYGLTDEGWLRGILYSGIFDSQEFRHRAVQLVKYFKSKVKGRALAVAFVSHREINTVLPFFWVANVVRSGALQELCPDKKMNVRWDEHQMIFRVPSTFALPEN